MGIKVDRSLKDILIETIHQAGVSDKDISKVAMQYYADTTPKEATSFLKKIKSSTITWRTYLQTLKVLELTDIKICIEFRQRISPSTYSEPIKVEQDITQLDIDKASLSPTELSILLRNIFTEANVSQHTYINRVIDWYKNTVANEATTKIRTRVTGFIKKVGGDNITWVTLRNAMAALGVTDTVFHVAAKRKGKYFEAKVNI